MKSFEIYNSRNEITRSGVLENDRLRVEIKDEDKRIIVKENNAIIYSNNINKIDNTKQEYNDLVFIRSHDGSNAIYINKYRYGFNKIKWIRLQDKNREIKEAVLKNNIFSLNNFIPGDYEFWATKDNNESQKLNISILDNSKEFILNKIKENISNRNEIHDSVLKNLNEDKDILINSIVKLINSSDESNIKEIADIALIYEMLWNNEILIANNFKYILNEYIRTPRTIDNLDADILIIYEHFNNQKKPHSKLTNRKFDLYLKPGKYYTIEAYKNNNLVGSIMSLGLKEDMILNNWKIEKLSKELLDELNQRKKVFKFDDVSNVVAAFEQMKNINYRLIDAPIIVIDNNYVNIVIEEYSLLKAIGGDFYISISETDKLFKYNKSIKKKIVGKSSNYKIQDIGIFKDKIYVCNIINSNGKQISKDFVISMNQEDDIIELRSKQLQDKINRLILEMSNADRKDLNRAKDLLSYLSESQEINKDNLYKSFIPQIRKDVMNFSEMVDIILRDTFNDFDVNEKFFEVPVKYVEKDKILIAPIADFEYVAEIDRFNIGDNIVENKYYNITNQNKNEIYIGDFDYCIISFFNKNDYASSGFIVLSSLMYDKIFLKYKIELEVK